jgi:hypothetical protein
VSGSDKRGITVRQHQFWILPFLALTIGTPVIAAKWSMRSITGTEAIAEFKRICVANFLDQKAIVSELNTEQARWTALKPLPKGYITAGKYWRSNTAEVGYVSQPNQTKDFNDPACHFTFVLSKNDTHGSLVALATEHLKLGTGRETGKPVIKQRRWDYEDVGGVKSRIFVTSNLKSDGLIVSRFSISRHRVSEPVIKAY